MTKLATLLALLLGASFMLTTHAQVLSCELQYQDYYDPDEDCQFFYDPNDGTSHVNCATSGPGEPTGTQLHASVNSANPSFSNPSFPVQNVWLFGNCDCTVKAYSRENLGGCYVGNDVDSENVGRVGGSTLWNKAGTPQSFSVTCQF